MGIQFEVDVRPDYVYLSCTGVFSNNALQDVFEKGLTLAEDKKLMAILVDIRGLGGAPASTIQRFNQGAAIPRIQLEHSSRICLVLVGDEPMIDPERFGETVAVNRGATGKVFTDIDKAVIWLEKWIEKHKPIGVIAVGQDITERKTIDEALKESEKKYRTLIENIPDVAWTTDISGNTIFISPNVQDVYGYTAEEIYEASHKLWFERIHPDDVERVKNKFYDLFNNGTPLDVEYRIKKKDEKWIWLLDRSTGTYMKGGILFADGLFSDITDRKQAEDALHSSEEKLRAMASRLQEVEEDERKGLARELHDRVGPNLTGLSINLNLIRSQLSAKSLEKIADRLDDSMSLVEETTKCIRDVMAELRPEVLYDYGLIAALRWHCNEFEKRTGISTILQGKNLTLRMPEYVESGIFRIAQEALTNVAKHAEVKQVTLAFADTDGMFRLTITDDGKGFDYTAMSKSIKQQGWGLLIMQERAQAFGGQIHVESEPGKGTSIIVEVNL